MRLIKKLLVFFLVFITLAQFNIAEAKKSDIKAKTVTYYSGLQADLYSKPSKKLMPAVILIHGGSWISGDRKELADFGEKLAEKGFFAMSIDYHLLPDYSQKTQVKDVVNAVWWLRENSRQLGVDSNRIGVVGISAGGYLTAWLATHDEVSKGWHSKPNAAVNLYGPWDLTKEVEKEVTSDLAKIVNSFCADKDRKEVSPLYQISESMPPMLIVHGDADRMVPVSQSIKAYAKMMKKGCDCELVVVPEDGHLFPHTESYFNAMDLSIKFLKKVLK